ncbi:MAG: hypothetical protein RIR85_88, partial [Pseudomonadota bacterium]
MIKRTFTSDSYDKAFSEQAIKTPVFQENFIKKLTGEKVRYFCSRYGLLLMTFINLLGALALLIYMISQFHEIQQSIDIGRSKVTKLEGL